MPARPGRKRFVNYYEYARQQLVASGITAEQIEEMRSYGLLAKDNVTGYWEGRAGIGRYWTLLHAIQHVKETAEEAIYVEMDVRNLGGLNAALGHANANTVFAEIAAVSQMELSAIASDSTFFRHGGDETSAFLIDTTERGVRAALGKVQAEVVHLAKKHGILDIPHPKHRNNEHLRGIGLHFGMSKILPQHETNPKLVFTEADTELELRKERPAEEWNCIRIGPLFDGRN